MSLQYVGSLSLAELVPTSFALFAQLDVYIQAQLTGAITASLNISILPPTLVATVTVAASILADLQAALALGLTLPSVSLSASLNAQIAILAALVASLNALIALGGGSIDAFTWSGPVDALGPAVTGELASGAPSGGSPFDASNAMLLLTRSQTTWTAMSSFFGGI